MVAFFIIIAGVLPPLVWVLGYLNLAPEDDDMTMEEAKKAFRRNLLRHRFFWAWACYVVVLLLIYTGWGSQILEALK